jgi:hypothetical protein
LAEFAGKNLKMFRESLCSPINECLTLKAALSYRVIPHVTGEFDKFENQSFFDYSIYYSKRFILHVGYALVDIQELDIATIIKHES